MKEVTGSGAIMRSQLGRVRGLGTARSGAGHWWAQRLTAAALVLLAVWFVLSLLAHLGADRTSTAHWAGRPWNSVLLLALLVALFQHLALGLQVVIEDYVHGEGARLTSLAVMKAVLALLWLAAVVAVLKLAFAG
ncbi:MAG TPA: succinate dehydrogenase, hydrophobic membrane anchor protein [Acetobacteraceae bacterium]|nr:succinate dehydrogenase, hydrophobic membrane anchor protein [Acetobacteraceae bacterium]